MGKPGVPGDPCQTGWNRDSAEYCCLDLVTVRLPRMQISRMERTFPLARDPDMEFMPGRAWVRLARGNGVLYRPRKT